MTPRKRRPPRDNEVSLLLSLATGPRRLTTGPVGRCTKRGWCRRHLIDPPDARASAITYELTEKGWSELLRLEALSVFTPYDAAGSRLKNNQPGSPFSCS
jgi:hypothetical protein